MEFRACPFEDIEGFGLQLQAGNALAMLGQSMSQIEMPARISPPQHVMCFLPSPAHLEHQQMKIDLLCYGKGQKAGYEHMPQENGMGGARGIGITPGLNQVKDPKKNVPWFCS